MKTRELGAHGGGGSKDPCEIGISAAAPAAATPAQHGPVRPRANSAIQLADAPRTSITIP